MMANNKTVYKKVQKQLQQGKRANKKDFEKFVDEAIKNPGALKKKAQKAGQTVDQFCQGKHDTKTTQQCNFYENMLRKKKQNKKAKKTKQIKVSVRRR